MILYQGTDRWPQRNTQERTPCRNKRLMESHLESIAAIEEDYEDALQMIKELRERQEG